MNGKSVPHNERRLTSEDLLPVVYDELKVLAQRKLSYEKRGQTLNSTDLVHEAYLRLSKSGGGQVWSHKGHFFKAVSETMRRILIDRARRKSRLKHGGGRLRVQFDNVRVAAGGAENDFGVDLLDLEEAFDLLHEENPAVAELVKLRFYGGLTIIQAAEATGTTVRTASRNWAFGRARLSQLIQLDIDN